MYFVYRFLESEDPALLAEALWRHKVAHQIVLNDGKNELWLQKPSHLAIVEQLISIWKESPTSLKNYQYANDSSLTTPKKNVTSQLKKTPVTILLLLIALVVAAVTKLGSDLSTVSYFTISPFEITNNQIYFYQLSEVFSRNEYWRLFTPALLHFSVLHLVFNTLWIWDIGRKLEFLLGSIVWSVGVVIVAILSNVLQYEISGYPLFGGLSGVVYGVIGFAWLLPVLNKQWPTIISKQLMVFFTVWLGVGYTPIPEAIGLGSIANTAHSIGLIAGLLLGFVYGAFTRNRRIKLG
jgi:GlpG protein